MDLHEFLNDTNLYAGNIECLKLDPIGYPYRRPMYLESKRESTRPYEKRNDFLSSSLWKTRIGMNVGVREYGAFKRLPLSMCGGKDELGRFPMKSSWPMFAVLHTEITFLNLSAVLLIVFVDRPKAAGLKCLGQVLLTRELVKWIGTFIELYFLTIHYVYTRIVIDHSTSRIGH